MRQLGRLRATGPIAPYCGLTLCFGALLLFTTEASANVGSWRVKLAECMFSCESQDSDNDGMIDQWVCDDKCPPKIVAKPCGPGMAHIDQLDERTWECFPKP